MKHAPDEFRKLGKLLADKYFCNFSLFQSLPDSWAIDQMFPIMPIQRLDERPDREATLRDDLRLGRQDCQLRHFAFRYHSAAPALAPRQENYYRPCSSAIGPIRRFWAIMHNLFGDTNAVHVSVNSRATPSIS